VILNTFIHSGETNMARFPKKPNPTTNRMAHRQCRAMAHIVEKTKFPPFRKHHDNLRMANDGTVYEDTGKGWRKINDDRVRAVMALAK
jgi:hypothetical protein